ncbi:MAG: ABC transporter permease [Saprospiraceae bacterium]|nr:ABC transporter permease [Saprospiraceae bacterium]MCF8248566.1 ABC transporter permease [Saprospiraceae bacterium]MCF8280267.1 ABC transporter permease [Bacteroidales bacterium]MCF8310299.1 ABC transporter permease [Saprospiraceae bacterium]MCF8439261.1 ABC transporter permease [Saprospiraceae bacterium]
MFKNNLTIAWRNILKHKLQTGINIAGLAIGIAGCLVVFLLSKYELAFNEKVVDADRIYRVYTQYNGQFSGVNAGVPTGVATLAATAVEGTDVQCLVQVYNTSVTIPTGQGAGILKRLGKQEDIVLTSPEFFDLIQNYEWLAGSPRQSLTEPYQLVLTERKVKQYFGVKDAREAIGMQVLYQDSLNTIVAGVLKDPDFSSDFHFTDFISDKTIASSFLKDNFPIDEWSGTRSADQFFVKASQGVSAETLTGNLKPLNDRFNKDNEPGEATDEFLLQPLADLHFNQDLGIFDTGRRPAHKPTLYGLMLIAGLLLLIAAINFVNLATVQATRRSKETGVRKVIGASRKQIAGQFLAETFLITLLALPVALALSELAMRYFSEFLPDGLTMSVQSPSVLAFLLGSVVLVTFLAGLYPSVVMSAFHPAFAIKNQSQHQSKGVGLRKGLIVFQFVLAQAFIIGSLIMGKQLNFVLKKDLGFDKEAIVYFWTDRANKKVLQEQLGRLPEVKGTALQNKPPIDRGYQTSVLEFDRDGEHKESEVHFRMVDTAYIGLFGIELLAGRNVLPSDTMKEVIINETFAKDLGFATPDEAVGQSVSNSKQSFPIVGVVKDFHVRSLHNKIPPLVITGANNSAYSVAAKISSDQTLSASLEKVKAVWEEVYPGKDFNPYFLDESVEKLYESETKTAKLINTATGLAIFISCLGLFGLAFFTVTQRSKEISVRKILGASIAGIVGLLSKDFLKLVLASLVLATPIAWYFMDKWLQDFAYRIGIQWWMFVVAGAVAVAVAFLTVSFQSVKAALANPVKSLRSE